jgi:hypothetical protein
MMGKMDESDAVPNAKAKGKESASAPAGARVRVHWM